MPFTPYHWGLALAVGLLLPSLFSIPVLVISSVTLDIEGIVLSLTGASYLHGFFHSYFGASLVGAVLVVALYSLHHVIDKLVESFRLRQKSTLRNMTAASLFGVYSHVLLDSFLYPDIMPFYPFHANPLQGLISSNVMYAVCSAAFILAAVLYFRLLVARPH